MKKGRTPAVCTSLHVVKGALVKVFNTPLTVTVDFTSKTKGRITVEYDGPPPSEKQRQEVEDLANEIVRDDVEVKNFKIDRKEAEDTFKARPVNGTFIYDKFPVPAELTELSLVHIDDWNINCCPGDHLKRTGELKYIKILRLNHRNNEKKKEIEACIELLDEAPEGAASGEKGVKAKGGSGKPQAPPAVPKEDITHVSAVAESIMSDVFAELYQQLGGDEALLRVLKEKEQLVREASHARVESRLALLRNSAYTSGFFARAPSQQGYHH